MNLCIGGSQQPCLTANLLLVHFQSIAIGHVQRVRCVFGAHAGTIEQETDGRQLLSLALAEGVHELFQLCCALDFEEDLVVIIGDLDVEVLNRGRGGGFAWCSVVGNADG